MMNERQRKRQHGLPVNASEQDVYARARGVVEYLTNDHLSNHAGLSLACGTISVPRLRVH